MTDAELHSHLFADRLEQAELEHVIRSHFGGSTSEGNHTTYRRDGRQAWADRDRFQGACERQTNATDRVKSVRGAD